MSTKPPKPAKAAGNSPEPNQTDSDSTDARAACTGESGSEPGATLSNTAPYNCNGGMRGSPSDPLPAPAFRLLRLGVDSLYLSYGGELSPETLDVLNRLKKLAQSDNLEEQITAQYPVGNHIFTVYDKGERNFPFVMEDAAYRIKFSRSGKKLPMAYVKVSAYYLAHKSLQAIQGELQDILSGLGSVGPQLVSRIDLAADFSSATAMDSWGRNAWITRASDIDAYSKDQRFTGWTVGKGGAVSCRLYDKVKEIEKSGKTWLFDLWKPAGWIDADTAWRLEFQFKRDFLKTRGLDTLDQVREALNGLWSYASTEWLRLCLPSETDNTRSRWPLHPLWIELASVDWDSPQATLTKVDLRTVPKEDWLKQQALGLITTTMALHGIDDPNDALDHLVNGVYEHYERVALRNGMTFDEYLILQARKKGRLFTSLINKPGQVEELRERFAQDQDNPYRKASRGE